jgi:hypothetical protein
VTLLLAAPRFLFRGCALARRFGIARGLLAARRFGRFRRVALVDRGAEESNPSFDLGTVRRIGHRCDELLERVERLFVATETVEGRPDVVEEERARARGVRLLEALQRELVVARVERLARGLEQQARGLVEPTWVGGSPRVRRGWNGRIGATTVVVMLGRDGAGLEHSGGAHDGENEPDGSAHSDASSEGKRA